MAVRVKTKKGKEVTLLNPKERRDKFFAELRTGQKFTNDGQAKGQGLTNEERAYRSGYLAAQNENAKIYKKKHPRYKRVKDR